MQSVLLVVQFLIAIALVGVILLQRTAQDGGGLAGGGATMGGLFTARGSANFLTRTTALLATAFIINSLTLGYMAGSEHQTRSLVDQIAPLPPASQSAPAKTEPAPAQNGKSSGIPALPKTMEEDQPASSSTPAPQPKANDNAPPAEPQATKEADTGKAPTTHKKHAAPKAQKAPPEVPAAQ